MRARIAAFVSRMAAWRSGGVVSQCGRGGDWTVLIDSLSLRKDSLLDATLARIAVLDKSPD